MIYWYQNLYMDEAVEKNPKRCKKRVEKRRPWKKSYVVLTLAQNDKNLFEIMQTRQLFFRRYRHVDMYVVALTSDYDAAVEILQQILEKGYRENPEYNPRNVFVRVESNREKRCAYVDFFINTQMDFHYTWHTFRTCFTIYGSCFMCAGALPGSRG